MSDTMIFFTKCYTNSLSTIDHFQRGRSDDPPDVKLSKFLSYICRHGAEREGIQMHQGMYNLNRMYKKRAYMYMKIYVSNQI